MPDVDAFRREQRRVAAGMAGALAISCIVFGLVAVRAPAIPSFAERLQSSAKAELLIVVWLAAGIADVARLRFFSAQDIAGSSGGSASARVDRARAILQNTLEQSWLAIAAHLVLTATSPRSPAIVPALAGLFAMGRLLFWRGYAHGAGSRAFGFALTFYPSVLALAYSGVMVLFGTAG